MTKARSLLFAAAAAAAATAAATTHPLPPPPLFPATLVPRALAYAPPPSDRRRRRPRRPRPTKAAVRSGVPPVRRRVAPPPAAGGGRPPLLSSRGLPAADFAPPTAPAAPTGAGTTTGTMGSESTTTTTGTATAVPRPPRTCGSGRYGLLPADDASVPTSPSSALFETAAASPPPRSSPVAGAGAPSERPQQRRPRWLERLSSMSNAASLLCVVDCTVLPLATIALPLIGAAAGAGATEALHTIGHAVAMYFVLPVGTLAAATNFLSHRNPLLILPSLAGLALVYLANAPHASPALALLPHSLAHSLHCGSMGHRLANVSGCALLLLSNYLSGAAGGSDCAVPGCGRWDCRSGGADAFFAWDGRERSGAAGGTGPGGVGGRLGMRIRTASRLFQRRARR